MTSISVALAATATIQNAKKKLARLKKARITPPAQQGLDG
jgi:hypothetical protein